MTRHESDVFREVSNLIAKCPPPSINVYALAGYPDDYASVMDFDEMLAKRQPMSRIRSRVFLSRSRKRIRELTCQDCDDAQTFEYRGRQLWNGF